MSHTVVYSGSAGEAGASYTRMIQTASSGPNRGALFLTFEWFVNVDGGRPVFPIYRSRDEGVSWSLICHVADTALGLGNRYQPCLYELPIGFADFDPGTLFLAGNAIPEDMSETHIVLYASRDGGDTWEYLSTVDSGGPALYDPRPESTSTAVWEPHLLLIGDQFICYYSDERLKSQGALQALVHRSSYDAREWSGITVDFAAPDRWTRPGMLMTTSRLPSGEYVGVFEVVGPATVPVHIARSTDGLTWGDPSDLGTLLCSDTGVSLSGTPHIAWSAPTGGPAAILVTGRLAFDAHGQFTNSGLMSWDGDRDTWRAFCLPVPTQRSLVDDRSGYSQTALLSLDGTHVIQATTVCNSAGSHDVVVGVGDLR